MTFSNWNALSALVALPIFIALAWFSRGGVNTLKNTQVRIMAKLRSRAATTLTCSLWACKLGLAGTLILICAQPEFVMDSWTDEPAGIIHVTQDTSGSIRWGTGVKTEVELPAVYDSKWAGWKMPKPNNKDPMHQSTEPWPQRIDACLGAIKVFIEHSHGLRIGLTAFDDDFYHSYPATSNLQAILEKLSELHSYLDRGITAGGTNLDGPSKLARLTGALQGAVNLFKDEPENEVHIWILVTDGGAAITPERAAELKAWFERLKIHAFVFGVGSEWAENAAEVKPLMDFMKSVGGEIAPVQDTARFQAVVDQIDKLARSSTHKVKTEHRVQALLILMAIAAALFIGWLICAALRRVSL